MKKLVLAVAVTALSFVECSTLFAQAAAKTSASGGFDVVIRPVASGEERKAQADLWVFELHLKSLRMLEVEITNPKTGQKQPELVYYLVYKAINRAVDRQQDDPERVPVNEYDKEPIPDFFVPQITLVTNDNGKRTVVPDSIIPEAQKAIEARERMKLHNHIEIVQRIPERVAADVRDPDGFFGVAIFRSVDPDTDHFALYMSGFSNGYKLVKGPVAYSDLEELVKANSLLPGDQIWNGDVKTTWQAAASVGALYRKNGVTPPDAETSQWFYTVSADRGDDTVTVWRKTLTQKYWRPGDRLDQNEDEIRRDGEASWIYRPDDLSAKNASQTAARQVERQ